MFFLIDKMYNSDDIYIWIADVKTVHKLSTSINHGTKYKIDITFLVDRASISFTFSDRSVRDDWFTKICEGISKPQLVFKG